MRETSVGQRSRKKAEDLHDAHVHKSGVGEFSTNINQ
jgi:hypothetical protein